MKRTLRSACLTLSIKMQIAAKEANETDYWLLILERTGYFDRAYEDIRPLLESVRRMLTATLNTAKKKLKEQEDIKKK